MQLVEQGFELVVGDQVAARCRRAVRGFRRRRRSRCRVEGVDLERTLAMQLVEQGFEFVVGDIGAFRRRGRCGRRARRCGGFGGNSLGGELALAVQLIEQRLELGVGDLVATRFGGDRGWRRGRLCLFLDRVERVEEQFEFIVGDVAGIAFGDRLDDRFLHHGSRCFTSSSRLRQARQGGQQFRGGRGDRATFADFAEHAVDRIQRFQDHVHQFRVDATLTLAQDVEHVLGDVTALHQLVELEEAGAPFYSVKTAKNGIEQIRVIRAAFQLDQLLGQLLKNLAGLNQEILKDLFIGAEAHVYGCS